MPKKKAQLEYRTCMIVDATYSPYVAEDADSDSEKESPFSDYGDSVIILLQDVETYNTYHCPLTSADIQSLIKSSEELTPRQLIKFAEALSNRESPVTLLVAPDSQTVTPEMIGKLQEKGLLTNEKAMQRYNEAKEKKEQIQKEQDSVPQTEYEQFMQEQDEALKAKFEEWRLLKEQKSRESVFLDIDNMADEEGV
jgi:gas vesicle protein